MELEFDLTPKFSQKITEGEGGEYNSWSSTELPLLSETKVGAGRLVLHPRGFALPHYADSAKLGFVLQGCDGVVGMVLANDSKEVVLKLKKGDLVPVPLGAVSWWFNDGDSDLDIVFLGDTSKAHFPGNITYFFVAGAVSMLGGFSTDFVKKAFGLDTDEEANKLVKSQTGVLVIKLDDTKTLPKPKPKPGLVYDLECSKRGGFWSKVTKSQFPFLGEVGLSANHIRLEANAMTSPVYTCDSSTQVIYVVNGGGKIQVVGFNGKLVLDTQVKTGHLVVVPKFFVVSKMAGEEGMECISIITSAEPVVQNLAGTTSVLEALSSEVLQTSFNVTPDFEQHLTSKMRSSSIISPPK
ncbi:13S globulin seed storage protein-like [Humulus lupulus]|uniref:13S globulin seed storage protein-like n=1 Tax=Humulus lupulus TaxID=3486 RepID=UPI002B41274C|nr:13S globulin seed storage protein-like [Humulus lupulus]